ncbi:AI-2E family transporter [Rhodohalobacter sp. 614A]|uniref:AI-2E family transporter n=1 Tax=Rhodohalobacter sp. 614A TaxID=2908649 RepID=UPI001F3EC176|nr:AI-2E family transporter [Rhodohalobacter sp. 614A]
MLRNLTLEKVVKSILFTAGVLIIGLILYNYSSLAIYAIIALIFSYLLEPLVNRMQAAGIPRTLSIIVTLTTVLLIVIWISTSIIPIVANRMAILTRQLQSENLIVIAQQVETHLRNYFDFIPPGYLEQNVAGFIDDIFNFGRVSNVVGNVIAIFTNLFAAFLVIPFATFFFLKDGYKIRRDLMTLIPNKYFETTLSLIDKIESRLGYYFRSVLLQCSLVGVASWLALSIAGLNNAATVGIIIGVANTIPYFGPVMGYVISILVSIIETGDFTLVIPCILAVMFAQILDNIILQPLIFSKSADMHPVAILFIILIGAQTAGVLGMLVAIPIATIVKITVNQIIWSFNNYQVFKKNRRSLEQIVPKSDVSEIQP